MGPTPLYDCLTAFAATAPLRMHMPGHKGCPLPVPELAAVAAIDVTELPPTGNLFLGDGPIRQAEHLWEAAFGMAHCLFLTGGSTQGVLSALHLACPPGAGILLDRGCHRSAYHGMALLDLHPVYLPRPLWRQAGVTGPISPEIVAQQLDAHPDIKTVCITSPTYYGVLSDIPAIAAAVHARGGVLVVDAAHGGHLPFLGDGSLSAGDLVVVSAHKTLPALGQTALLFSGGRFPHQALCRSACLFGSSSPSYPLMASLDVARAYLEGEGAARYRSAADGVARLRGRYPCLTGSSQTLDPCRLVLCTGDGFAAARALEAQGVFPEMADEGHVVLILTCCDGEAELTRLAAALDCLAAGGLLSPPPEGGPCGPCGPGGPGEPGGLGGPGGPGGLGELLRLPPAAGACRLSPRQATFARREWLPLCQGEGRISAQILAPYPPGIPIVAPGEVICKKHLAYLERIGYNMKEEIEAVEL